MINALFNRIVSWLPENQRGEYRIKEDLAPFMFSLGQKFGLFKIESVNIIDREKSDIFIH